MQQKMTFFRSKHNLNSDAKDKVLGAFLPNCQQVASTIRLGKPKPSCFISYAWDTPAYSQWVEWFAINLKNSGFDVYLDIWSNQYGEALTDYVENMTKKDLDFIVVLGTPLFLEKYNAYAANEASKDPVVKFEAKLMNYMMMYNEQRYKKIIPIPLIKNIEGCFPSFMCTKVYNGNFSLENPYNHIAMLDLAVELYSINILKMFDLKETDPKFFAIKDEFKKLKSDFALQLAKVDAQVTPNMQDDYLKQQVKRAKMEERKADLAVDAILTDLLNPKF